MGVWLAARAGTYRIRDGKEPTDKMVDVTTEPVWFEKLEPADYLNDPQVEVLMPEGKGAGKPKSSAQKEAEDRERREREEDEAETDPARRAERQAKREARRAEREAATKAAEALRPSPEPRTEPGVAKTEPPMEPRRASYDEDTTPHAEHPEKQGVLSRVLHGKRDK
jgi:hypothetical protein